MAHNYFSFLYDILGVKVYPYGVFIAVGILSCLFVFYIYSKRVGMPESIQNFIFYVAVFAIVVGFGASKLYQAIYNWIETGHFDVIHAGITAMGGFIGGAVSFIFAYFVFGNLIYKKKDNLHKKYFNTILRIAPCCVTIAHAFGRIGCLMAGCCHGELLSKTEYVFGGIYMYAQDTGVYGYYVPTQLYESLFLFLLFAVLSILFFKRSNITAQVYLIAYGIWRIIIELFRTDSRGAIVLGLSPSQWQSIIFIALGVFLLIFYKIKRYPFILEKGSIGTPLFNEKKADE